MNATAKRLRFLILASGVIACTALIIALTNQHPFPFVDIDEHAHFSYAQALISQQRWWPDFYHFPLYDTAGNALVDKNYMSHPPLFYWAMKLFHPASVETYRQFALIFNIATVFVICSARVDSSYGPCRNRHVCAGTPATHISLCQWPLQ